MKIAYTIARILMGIMFTVFGLNGFLNFIPAPPKHGVAAQFLTVMVTSDFMAPVFLIQLAAGILFLINRYVPLALTLIGPVIVNILIFHLTMDPSGIPPGIVVAVLWAAVFYRVRGAFAGIFQAQVAEPAT